MFFDRAEVASEDYQDYYPYLKSFDDERFRWELRIRRRKFEKQLALMQRYLPAEGRRVLDVGAGPGYLVRVALDEGWEAYGVEVSAEAVRHGVREYGVRYLELDDVEAESFDAVTCHHVLEHIADASSFLTQLRSKLRPGGLLVLHVPHQQPLTWALRGRLQQRLSNGRADTFCDLHDSIHISGFTQDSLRAVLERHGFETRFIRTAGMWSKYYDPFFLRALVQRKQWGTIARNLVRHVLESAGVPFGMGHWVIGYFSKAAR